MRKTKIVCTMGPACDDEETLAKMIDAGMNVVRINMSHGTYEEQKERLDRVKKVIHKSDKYIALMLDTKGPEVRIGTFPENSVALHDGQMFSLYKDQGIGDEKGVSISYPALVDLMRDSKKKDIDILMDDGKIILRVESINQDAILCRVQKGGTLSNRKSINIPGFPIDMPFISDTDRADIAFGLEQGIDCVAASFVRSGDDVREMRALLRALGHPEVEIISKIENQSGVDHLDEIIQLSDGIMVARGDMGVEIPFIKLPAIQKGMIQACIRQGKYVITATQMLESMLTNSLPTRAEINDVANAVYDGTSAVMLSGESAAGQYPVESVRTLASICEEAEKNEKYMTLHHYMKDVTNAPVTFRDTICAAAKNAAEYVGAKAIIAVSKSGRTPRAMAHFRPNCPIVAVALSAKLARLLTLNWGIFSTVGEEKATTDEIIAQAMQKALDSGVVKQGDYVVVLSANKIGSRLGTDTLSIKTV